MCVTVVDVGVVHMVMHQSRVLVPMVMRFPSIPWWTMVVLVVCIMHMPMRMFLQFMPVGVGVPLG